MQPLTGETLLGTWERGAHQNPIDRALSILAAAFPEAPRDRLIRLSVGRRDSMLLAVRSAMFGPTLRGFVECPACAEPLEFEMDLAYLGIGGPTDFSDAATDTKASFDLDEYSIRFRLPDSRDLAAISGCPDVATAREALARRCLVAAERDGAPATRDDLPDEITAELARQMAALEPQAEVLFDLNCPACRGRWQSSFDPGIFLWAELAVAAGRLIREAQALARAYGWRETDILAMSAWRRRQYLDLLVT